MLADVEVAVKGVELVAGTHIIVMLQDVHREALAEAAGADEEEEAVGLLYQGDEVGFVHVVIILLADEGEVHHAVGQTFAVGE